MSVVAASSTPPTAGSARDDFIDLCRAFSLLIVVMWHWVFTIVGWRTRGPSANSPLGFTDNLWILTWFLQVMPLFFGTPELNVGASRVLGHLKGW